MRHRVHTFKIGRTSSHRRAMLANMVSSLFEHGQIQTTLVRAKEARIWAEKLITMGKAGDLHRRRLAVAKLHNNKTAAKILFDEVAPRYTERTGGYTRIIKLGKRLGDAAEMCILQLVEAGAPAAGKKAPAKKAAPKAASKEAPKATIPEENEIAEPIVDEENGIAAAPVAPAEVAPFDQAAGAAEEAVDSAPSKIQSEEAPAEDKAE